MQLREKPFFTKDTIKDMEDMSYFTHALIFDDLLIVAQKETDCLVLKSSEGLILFDAIWPAKKVFDAIVNAITDVGWNPNELKKFIITHGHVDHTGCGRYFVENYHVQTYLSEVDDKYWEEHPTKPDRPETWKDFKIEVYVKDKDTITLGDKTIYAYSTPGHTPGCFSYIFPVTEGKEVHMAALWGGTTPPWNKDGIEQYMKSIDYFETEAKKMKVDVALSNHTANDNGLERIAYSKKRMTYMPNVYVIGQEGYCKYLEMIRRMSEGWL